MKNCKYLFLLVFYCLLVNTSIAQSDDCTTAPEIMVFTDCLGTPGDTKNFSGVPTGNACGGNTDDDGWFKFKAISTKTRITVSTDQLTDMGIGVFKDCSQEVECINARALGGEEILEFETELGVVYFIQVFEVNAGGGEFMICVSSVADNAQSDCPGAVVICKNDRIAFTPQGSGQDDFESEKNEFGCLKDKENQSAWYYFEIQDQAPPNLMLTFNLSPETSPDYDFAVFGPDVLCEKLGYPIRCSWADAYCEDCPRTGLGNGAKDVMEGADGDGFVAPLLVQPGEGYFLLVDNYWQSATGFILEWGGEAAPYLNCAAQPPCGIIANAGLDQIYCGETLLTLNGLVKSTTGQMQINWTGLDGAGEYLDQSSVANPVIQIPDDFSATLHYFLKVTSDNCIEEDSISIFPDCNPETDCTKPITADITISPPNCSNPLTASIQIGLIREGTPPYSFQIREEKFQSNPIFFNLSPGTYPVKITDALGCQTDTIVEIPMADPLILNIGDDITGNQGESIDLQVSSNINPKQIKQIVWSGIDLYECTVPCLAPQFTATNSTLIEVMVTTIEGCTLGDELKVIVEPKVDIYIPNAFSPNGDGINDVFFIQTGPGISSIDRLTIVDRWGNVVFEAFDFPPNQFDFGWDGKANDRVFNNAVFAYSLVLELPGGNKELRSGEILLIR